MPCPQRGLDLQTAPGRLEWKNGKMEGRKRGCGVQRKERWVEVVDRLGRIGEGGVKRECRANRDPCGHLTTPRLGPPDV